jgi:uncharacterized membrane protein
MKRKFFGIMLLLTGAIVVAGAVPLRLGVVKPNPTVGVRFPQSFAWETNWYRINRYGGTALILWGLSALAVGALLLSPVRIHPRIALALGLLYPLTIVVPVLLTHIYALRL